MRMIASILKKEGLQLVRNKVLTFLVFICPVLILGVIPFSLEGEINIKVGIIDMDKSSTSNQIINRLNSPELFQKIIFFNSVSEAQCNFIEGNLELILIIPEKYEQNIIKGENPQISLLLDGSAPFRAKSNLSIIAGLLQENESNINFYPLFNRAQSHKHYLLLSLIILVITLVGTSLITLNIVHEKETGILEQFNATVLNRYFYIFNKYLFFIFISIAELIISLVFCYFIYGFIIYGSVIELFIATTIYMFPMLSIGFLVSVLSKNQVQSVYILTFIFLNLIMLGTMFTQLSSMPVWAQNMRFINPLYYMLEISRNIVFKGTPLLKMIPQLLGLVATGVVIVSLSVAKMSKSNSRW